MANPGRIIVGLGNPGRIRRDPPQYRLSRRRRVSPQDRRRALRARPRQYADGDGALSRAESAPCQAADVHESEWLGRPHSAEPEWPRALDDLLVIYDDIALPTGKLRLRRREVPAGIMACRTSSTRSERTRFRACAFGIGDDFPRGAQARYVLAALRSGRGGGCRSQRPATPLMPLSASLWTAPHGDESLQ
jgi:peptidyl-tRNA hydrolase, PTH1 family